jgi:hypothetical protein
MDATGTAAESAYILESLQILPLAQGVMDSYKSVLYTIVFQDENFLWRPGLGISR